MRTTFRHIIAATAAILTLFSCAKDLPVVETPAPGTDEDPGRVITASFSPATKTQPGTDGLTPMFTDGDLIKVSNGTAAPQVCTVRVNGKGSGSVAFFRTTLTGPLKAVYPADAAVLSGNTITGVSVLSNPSGKFRDANIAMAENVTTEARFHNKATILRFYVDASIGVKSIKITSTENIATGSKTITVDAGTSTLDQITDDPEKRLCYVPVLKGVNTHHMTFVSETTGQGQGTVTKTMTSDNTLEEGKMYNIFIPYYIDLGTAGKWGYCNVGAFLPEEVGCSFTWGATKGYRPASDKTFEEGHSFVIGNDPLYNGTKYTKYTTGTGGDGKTVLELVDDAACANWGDSWHLPTGDNSSGDFHTLLASTYWLYVDDDKGCYVFLPSDYGTAGKNKVVTSIDEATKAKAKLFFPATGAGRHDSSDTLERRDLKDGHYWTSWLSNSDNQKAYYMKFTRSLFSNSDNNNGTDVLHVTSYDRFLGRSIRPIYDGFSVEGELSDYEQEEFKEVPQDAPLTGVFTVSKGPDGVAGTTDDVKVKFSKGNLRYTIATSQWSFFEHQYDCGPANYADGHDKEISLFTWGKSFWSYVPDGAGYYEGFEDISGTTRDWGTGKWRTLTYDEWIYLLNSRSQTASHRGYAKAKLWNGVKGVILFPDDYPGTVGNSDGIQVYPANPFPTTPIPQSEWTDLESKGVVFLPAAGQRDKDAVKQHSSGENSHVEYWSSTPHEDISNSYFVHIGDNSTYRDYPGSSSSDIKTFFRDCGMSVRLVTDVAP